MMGGFIADSQQKHGLDEPAATEQPHFPACNSSTTPTRGEESKES